jgi:hypothetical protein
MNPAQAIPFLERFCHAAYGRSAVETREFSAVPPLLARLVFNFTCGTFPFLATQSSPSRETVVMVRHREKPPSGLGTLTLRMELFAESPRTSNPDRT